MTSVALALDTCVLSDKHFIGWIQGESNIDVVVPVVAYMERRRQIINNGRNPEDLEALLKACRMKVIPFDKNCATRASDYMRQQPNICPECGKLDWADVMILANIDRPWAVLVTHNIKDFERYGLGDRVMTPDEVVKKYNQWQ